MAGVTLPDQSFAPGPAASGCWDTPLQCAWGGTCTSSCPKDGSKHPPLFLGIARGALGEGFVCFDRIAQVS